MQQKVKGNRRSILGKCDGEPRKSSPCARKREQSLNPKDQYDLQRFVEAQSGVYEQVCRELKEGRKRSHWMWFIFPQLKGLGHSAMADRYGISSREEAEAYLSHSLLGSRLRHCAELVVAVEGRTVEQIFGWPDELKFRSSMTLFAGTDGPGSIFALALEKYFGGKPDPLTRV